jgi:hypothetical protein
MGVRMGIKNEDKNGDKNVSINEYVHILYICRTYIVYMYVCVCIYKYLAVYTSFRMPRWPSMQRKNCEWPTRTMVVSSLDCSHLVKLRMRFAKPEL